LSCTDKFGNPITSPAGEWQINFKKDPEAPQSGTELMHQVEKKISSANIESALLHVLESLPPWNLDQLGWVMDEIAGMVKKQGEHFNGVLSLLTLLNDRRYDCGRMKRSALLQVVRARIDRLLDAVASITSEKSGSFKRIDWETRQALRSPVDDENTLVISSRNFPPEGEDCDAWLAVRAYQMGWKRFIFYGLRGQRFHGCGFGPDSKGVRIDIYGSSGDYLGSGVDGLDIHVHDNGQDQLCQIMKNGRVVVHGDVGQTFLYGAKGGDLYVMGNAAGRPLINAGGSPRVVINGTCLDYLAESFMAGDPLNGGGFVILNGIEFDEKGKIIDQDTPYPGSNLFSLASGGAIYLRDPFYKVVDDQLNGGELVEMTQADWNLIFQYLKENERLLGISIENDLLMVNGEKKNYQDVYRKVQAVTLDILTKESISAEEWGEDWRES
jgi:glutamate synthase domain-containing protein 3